MLDSDLAEFGYRGGCDAYKVGGDESKWLKNMNAVEYLGIWERIHNPDFNCGEFAIIKSQAGFNCSEIPNSSTGRIKAKRWND